jgi:hypothetical protein
MEILVILGAVASAIFWMVVGWRAMLAHERLARAADHLARRLFLDAQPIPSRNEEDI